MKKKVSVIFLCLALLMVSSGAVRCEEKKQMGVIDKIKKAYSDFANRNRNKAAGTKPVAPAEVKKQGPAQPDVKAPEKPKKELTKEDVLKDIKDDLEAYDEIFEVIPGLKSQKDDAGKVSYTYNGMKLEDMTKEDLESLFKKVGPLAVKLRTERIQRQLDTIRRASTAAGAPKGPAAVPSVPQPPRAQSAPPSAPPRPAAPPSAPPTTRR